MNYMIVLYSLSKCQQYHPALVSNATPADIRTHSLYIHHQQTKQDQLHSTTKHQNIITM